MSITYHTLYYHKRLVTKYRSRDLAADQSRVANTRIKTILKGSGISNRWLLDVRKLCYLPSNPVIL